MTNPNDKVDGANTMARTGLTKREYFAAMALQGFNAFTGTINNKTNRSVRDLAILSVDMADALIAELNVLPVNIQSQSKDIDD